MCCLCDIYQKLIHFPHFRWWMLLDGEGNEEHEDKGENRGRPRDKVEINWKYWMRVLGDMVWHLAVSGCVTPSVSILGWPLPCPWVFLSFPLYLHAHYSSCWLCSPAHVAQGGERWTLKPISIGMWQPSLSCFSTCYLLLNGMVCGQWQRLCSRSDQDDVSWAGQAMSSFGAQ